jgi:hypothetical protein
MFLNPLGLLALLGVPLVVALHLFRRRFEPQRVSALFLWQAGRPTAAAGRRRERLLTSPSFWSEVLLALLLGLAFAGPRGCGALSARHLVVVLDGSASMTAGDGAAPSALELVREELRERIDGLPTGSRVTLVESGPAPRIVAGPAAFPDEALARLEGLAPRAGRHDLGPAAALALELAGGEAVTLYTDRYEPEALPEEVGVVALGRPRENLAVVRAARLRAEDGAPGEDEVLATIANLSGRERQVRVELVGASGLAREEALRIGPGAREAVRLRLAAGVGPVELRLVGDGRPLDAQPADDRARLMPPPERELRLACTLPPETRRALGLEREGGPPLGRWLDLVPRSSAAPSPEDADLVIAAEAAGGPRTWTLRLDAGAGEPADLVGPFLVDRRHPLADGLELQGVIWSVGEELELPGLPLVSAGNTPLLTEEERGEARVVHLGLGIARSTLQRSPDWPILLANLAEARRDAMDGPRATNLAVGEAFVFQAREPAVYALRGPDGERELRAVGTLEVDDLDEPGEYTLLRAGQELARFAVHLADDAESDLRALSSGRRESSRELAEARSDSSLLVLLLGLAALGAVLVDWWVLRPHTARAGGAA